MKLNVLVVLLIVNYALGAQPLPAFLPDSKIILVEHPVWKKFSSQYQEMIVYSEGHFIQSSEQTFFLLGHNGKKWERITWKYLEENNQRKDLLIRRRKISKQSMIEIFDCLQQNGLFQNEQHNQNDSGPVEHLVNANGDTIEVISEAYPNDLSTHTFLIIKDSTYRYQSTLSPEYFQDSLYIQCRDLFKAYFQ